MDYRKHQRVFWGLLAAALVIDSTFDFMAFRQSYRTEETRQAINQSYDVLSQLADLTISLHDFEKARDRHDGVNQKATLLSLQDHYRQVSDLIVEDPTQKSRFQPFSFMADLFAKNHLADLTREQESFELALHEARLTEQSRLQQSLQEDQAEHELSRTDLLVASMLDFILMIALGFVWFGYNRSRRKNDDIMASSIANTEKTNAELQNLLNKKAQELRTTVHDLKNPLGSIKGFSELLCDETDRTSLVEMTNSLRRLSEHSLELVNSLLEVESQSAAVNNSARAVNVIGYIEDVRLALRPETLRKRQRMVYHYGVHSAEVVGDPKKIWDLFMNLIGNAVKFSPFDSQIEIEARVENNFLLVEIKDQGPGFSAEDKKNAFLQFQKLSASPTGGETSSGLGLSICYQVVQACGGHIEIADRQPAPGAELRVRLPLSPH